MVKLALFAFVFSVFATSAPAFALDIGQQAPCVVLNHANVDNSTTSHCIRDPEIAGKPVVLEFFSVFCGACQASLPTIVQMADELKGIATFRQIGIDRNEADLRKYIADNRSILKFSVALDTGRAASRAYGIQYVPTTFVLDRNNMVIYKHEEALTASDVAEIKRLVMNAK